jgi:hypothetical protein
MLSRKCVRELLCALAALVTAPSAAWDGIGAANYRELDPVGPRQANAPDVAPPNDSPRQAAAMALMTDEQMPGLGEPPPPSPLADEFVDDGWFLQWLPTGLIYHSYMAGVHEPHMALVMFHDGDDRLVWDATLGGRVALVRYGSANAEGLAGYQLDFFGAAIARLDVEEQQDLDATDYVFGFPLTWGDECVQYKFGYAHLSSHLGDELAIREPSTLAERVNYVRDSVVFGTSYYPTSAWRMYGEVGWAFHTSGGAEPVETQFGTELWRPEPAGRHFAPFIALNARLREEHDFGGDVAAQVGIMQRGIFGQSLRFAAQYYNGHSSQFQFFAKAEEQIGMGVWYDF